MIIFLLWWYLMDIAKWYFDIRKFDIVWTLNNKNTNNGNTNNKNIYLTIDDVINNNSFEEILDVLDEYNVKATFFVISSFVNENKELLLKNKELLSRAVKSGHHLANHGKTNTAHFLCSNSKLCNEIFDCERLIKDIYNINNKPLPKIKYFRPGCGFVSQNITKICEFNKYKIVLGTVYPNDTKLPFPNLLYYYIKLKVKPNDIIILHDRKFTPSVLKKTLKYLKNNNYIIKSLE